MCVLVYEIFILQYKFDKIDRSIKKRGDPILNFKTGLEVKCGIGSPRIIVLIFNFDVRGGKGNQ